MIRMCTACISAAGAQVAVVPIASAGKVRFTEIHPGGTVCSMMYVLYK